jgi:hypothetical protein
MTALVIADDLQPVGKMRHQRVPEPQIGAQRICKDYRRAFRVAIDAVVQLHIAQIGHPHPAYPTRSLSSRTWAMICP